MVYIDFLILYEVVYKETVYAFIVFLPNCSVEAGHIFSLIKQYLNKVQRKVEQFHDFAEISAIFYHLSTSGNNSIRFFELFLSSE